MSLNRDKYLELLNKNARKDPAVTANPFSRYRTTEEDIDTQGKSLWDSLGEFSEYAGKGAVSGVTLGASEFISGMDIKWDELSPAERAGYITGEGLAMLAPFGLIGKGLKVGSGFLRGGSRAALKKGIETVTPKTLKSSSAVLARATKVAKATGKEIDDVLAEIAPEVQKKLKKDFLKTQGPTFRQPWMEQISTQAAKGVLKEQGRDMIQERASASITKALSDAGYPIMKSMSDDIAKKFTKSISSGVKHGDAAEMISKGVASALGPGWWKDKAGKYLGQAVNTSAIMVTHNLIRDAIVADARGGEYKPWESARAGVEMGAIFAGLQGIPNLFGKGTGDQSLLFEGAPLLYRRMLGTNYDKIAKSWGDKPLRSLLRMMTEGGKFNNKNISKLGNSKWTVNGKKYDGYSILTQVMDPKKMPTKDVISLLKKFRGKVGNSITKKWFKDYIVDLGASSPRIGIGLAAMSQGLIENWQSGIMSDAEFQAHLLSSAFMTRSRGGWATKAKYNYMQDFKPHQDALDAFNFKGDVLNDLFNTRSDEWSELVTNDMYNNKITKQIEDIFDENEVSVFPEGKSGFNVSDHRIIDRFQTIYNDIKGFKGGETFLKSGQFIDIKSKAYSKAQLDNMANALRNIKFDDGMSIDNMGLDRFRGRLVSESAKSMRDFHEKGLGALQKAGLPIVEMGNKQGNLRYQVGEINAPDGKDLGQFGIYNNFINAMEDIGIVQKAQNLSRDYSQIPDGDIVQNTINDIFDLHISSLNEAHGLNPIDRDPSSNPFIKFIKTQNKAEALERVFSIVDGTAKDKTDKNLSDAIIKVLNRGDGSVGFLKNMDMYRFDYSKLEETAGKDIDAIKEKYSEDKLRNQLRPILDLFAFKYTAPVDANIRRRAIDVKDAINIIEQFNNVKDILPAEYKTDFETVGVKKVVTDFMSAEDINARVVNSMVELQQTGLGNYVNGKMNVMNEAGIRSTAQDEGGYKSADIDEIVMMANEIHNAIGSNRIELKDYMLPKGDVERGFKAPSVGQYKAIYDNFRIDKLNDFLSSTEEIVNTLINVDSKHQSSVENIKTALNEIALGNLTGNDLTKKLQVLSSEVKSHIKQDQHKKDYEKILSKLEPLRNELTRAAKRVEGVEPGLNLNDFITKHNTIADMTTYLDNIFNKDTKNKNELAKRIGELVTLKANNELSSEAVLKMQDSLEKQYRSILGHTIDSDATIAELVHELNDKADWSDVREFTAKLDTYLDLSMRHAENVEFAKTDIDSFEKIFEDQAIHHSSETFQTIAGRYNLLDRKQENINPDIIDYIAQNKDKTTFMGGLTKKVYDLLESATDVEPAKIQELKNNWTDIRDSFVNALLRQRRVSSVKMVQTGDRLFLMHNGSKMHRQTKINDWFENKGYSVSYVEGNILAPNRKATLVNKSLNEFHQGLKRNHGNSDNALNDFINDKLQVIPESEKDFWKAIVEDKPNWADLVNKYTDEKSIQNMKSGFYLKLSPGNNILFHGTKKNKELLYNDFKTFYKDIVDKGLDDATVGGVNVRGSRLVDTFKQLYENVSNIDVTSKSQDKLKLYALYMAQKPGMFSKWLGSINLGDNGLRSKIEDNMLKRDWLVDGGTTIRPHPAIIRQMKSYHPDSDVREVADFLTNNKMKADVTIFDDEGMGAGTNIVERAKEQVKARDHKTGTSDGNKLSRFVAKKQLEDMADDVIDKRLPSLKMPLTDGAKYISKRMAKLLMALKGGNMEEIGGFKTIKFQLGKNSLLGKGYAVYDPKVASHMKGDFALGVSAAKEFSPSIMPLKVTGKDWYANLSNAQSANTIGLNIENVGVGFYSKKTKGVTLSNSMAHFESGEYSRALQKEMPINSIIGELDRMNSQLESSESDILNYLNQANEDQGFTQKQGLLSTFIKAGAKYPNPIVNSDANRAIRNKYFTVLSKYITKHGRDMTIVPDAESNLIMPEIMEFKDDKDLVQWRGNKTFGEISPDKSGMLQGLDNLDNTAFVINHKGFDFIAYQNGDIYQPSIDHLSKNKKHGIGSDGDNIDISWTRDKKKIYKEAFSKIKPIIDKLKVMSKDNGVKLSMFDMYNMLEGNNSHNTIHFSAAEKKIIKDNKIGLGSTFIAIPLKGYDKAFHRIKGVHEQVGLVKMNHYDERVIHQRDNDGDHLYGYWQLPFFMNKTHAKKMAFNKDFKQWDGEESSTNLMGLNVKALGETEAGAHIDNIGPASRYDQLEDMRKNVGKIIGERGSVDLLTKLGFRWKDEAFEKEIGMIVRDLSNVDNLNSNDGKVLYGFTDLSQNIVDLHKLVASVIKSNTQEYLRFNNKPADTKLKYTTGEDVEPIPHPLYNMGDQNDRNTELYKDVIDQIIFTTKSMNILNQDVYELGNKRTPEPYEINSAYYKLKSFFANPTQHVIGELMSSYSTLPYAQRVKKTQELMNHFYVDQNTFNSSQRMEEFARDLLNGKKKFNIKPGVRMGFNEYPKLGTAAGEKAINERFERMFSSTAPGATLHGVIDRKIFHERDHYNEVDASFHSNVGTTAREALHRLQYLDMLDISNEKLVKEFEFTHNGNTINFDRVNPVDLPSAVTLGALRSEFNRVYSRISNNLEYYSGSNYHSSKDKANIAKLNKELSGLEKAISILDRKYADNVIFEGAQKANIKKGFASKNGKSNAVNSDVYVMSIRGDLSQVDKNVRGNDLSDFNRIGWVKKGDRYDQRSDHTYFEIKNAMMHESVSNEHAKYSKNLADMISRLSLDTVGDDSSQLDFLNDVGIARNAVNDSYSKAIKDSKNRSISNRVWEKAADKDASFLDAYFNKNKDKLIDIDGELLDEPKAMEWLSMYLLKPKPLMSKYMDANNKTDLPVYKINKRLMKSTFKYLIDKGHENIVTDIIKKWEDHVSGKFTEDDAYAESYFMNRQDGFNYDAFGQGANIVRSLAGSGFYSPYYKEFVLNNKHIHNRQEWLRTLDNQKQTYIKTSNKKGCR